MELKREVHNNLSIQMRQQFCKAIGASVKLGCDLEVKRTWQANLTVSEPWKKALSKVVKWHDPPLEDEVVVFLTIMVCFLPVRLSCADVFLVFGQMERFLEGQSLPHGAHMEPIVTELYGRLRQPEREKKILNELNERPHNFTLCTCMCICLRHPTHLGLACSRVSRWSGGGEEQMGSGAAWVREQAQECHRFIVLMHCITRISSHLHDQSICDLDPSLSWSKHGAAWLFHSVCRLSSNRFTIDSIQVATSRYPNGTGISA